MTLYKWSQVAASDASADASINWAEGMSPAGVNDSGRAMMAAVAKYRDDIAGAIVTAGTSTAYTVASFQQFDTLPHLDGKEIAFTPHTTNGATVTLNVDSLGSKPLRSAPGVELPAGVIAQGTPYVAVYNNTDGAFYLRGFFGSPYLIPLGGMIDFTGTSAPNSSFVIPTGQPISRTTYAAYFAIVGTTYGTGDGSTTFNVPDLRGRVVAMLDNTGNLMNSATMTPDGNHLGATGGTQLSQLGTSNLPPYTPAGTVAMSGGSNTTILNPNTIISIQGAGGGSILGFGWNSGGNIQALSSILSYSFAGTAQGGTSAAFTNMQPTMALNKILRII